MSRAHELAETVRRVNKTHLVDAWHIAKANAVREGALTELAQMAGGAERLRLVLVLFLAEYDGPDGHNAPSDATEVLMRAALEADA